MLNAMRKAKGGGGQPAVKNAALKWGAKTKARKQKGNQVAPSE